MSYNKATSIGEFSGEADARAAVRRIASASFDHIDGWPRKTLVKAQNAIMDGAYTLAPHAAAEMKNVSDSNLPRWLHYRYRYDIFPQTHEIDAWPPCVQIEPTSICNYRCVFCFQTDEQFTNAHNGHMGSMSFEMFKEVIDQIQGSVEAVTLASRGEPLLGRHIEKMLAYIGGRFLALKINTNAWYLDEAMSHAILQAEPATLVFSADAADPELYAKLRVRGDLARVFANVAKFQYIRETHYPKSKTLTRVSGVKFSKDQDFSQMESFWKGHVDQVAFVDYNPWENAYEQPENDVVAPCSDLWRRLFVWWDGKINPCDVDYKSHLQMGTLRDGISNIWTGDAYRALRAKHLEGARKYATPCKGCVVT